MGGGGVAEPPDDAAVDQLLRAIHVLVSLVVPPLWQIDGGGEVQRRDGRGREWREMRGTEMEKEECNDCFLWNRWFL